VILERVPTILPETLGLAVVITVILVFTYLPVRIVYAALRWRVAMVTGRSCRKCGYDLTGNVTGRCPECGQEIKV
jgi:hypothetical protein